MVQREQACSCYDLFPWASNFIQSISKYRYVGFKTFRMCYSMLQSKDNVPKHDELKERSSSFMILSIIGQNSNRVTLSWPVTLKTYKTRSCCWIAGVITGFAHHDAGMQSPYYLEPIYVVSSPICCCNIGPMYNIHPERLIIIRFGKMRAVQVRDNATFRNCSYTFITLLPSCSFYIISRNILGMPDDCFRSPFARPHTRLLHHTGNVATK